MSPLQLGAAYYPEHWPESRWPEDIRLMREAGLTVARMAEFAWSSLEPAAGDFRLDWLERAVEQLAAAGIRTVLGTPTAAPPAWLMQQHPEIYCVGRDGRPVQFGARCHGCVNQPEMRAASQRIVTALAERFGGNPHVIGWQIDNEFARTCFCEVCQAEFQAFLRAQYGTLDALNAAWATAYWSQTYSDWTQIPLPWAPDRPAGSYHNPGLVLEHRRFVTASHRRFQREQIEALRRCIRPEVWITHNFMGWYGDFDHYALSADLDLVSWDWYIGTGHHEHLKTGAIHDLTRGFKRRNFWVMETQPGNVNWARVNSSLDLGEAQAMAWHAVAHGADAFLYWQWRSALGGQEQYHGTLVDQSGQPRPFYYEASLLGRDFAALGDLLDGSTVEAQVALLNDYESCWAIAGQPHHADFDYVTHFNHYYKPLASRNVAVDILSADTPAERLKHRLVIAPALLILDDGRAAALREYVNRGGILVLTPRTGMKDRRSALLPQRQPGPLVELTGAEVEDAYALTDPVPVKGNWFEGTSRVWAERLRIMDPGRTTPVAHYGACNGWLDGQPAITLRSFGRGWVFYTGAYLNDAAQDRFLEHILGVSKVATFVSPPGVEVSARVRPDGKRVTIVINHLREERTLTLPWRGRDHLSGNVIEGPVKLPPYAVAVLTEVTS